MASKPKPSGNNALNQAAQSLSKALSGASAPSASAGSVPTALGLTATESGLTVPFAIPHEVENIPAPQGATTNANGQVQASLAQVMQSYFKLDSAELQYVQEQMANGHLISAKDVTGHPNTATQNAWKKIALDSANSGTSFTTLLNIGASSGDYANMVYENQYAISTEQRQLAELKQGTYTQTDPNQIKQALVSAYASIGEAAPSPQFLDQFVQAYHNQEAQAELGVLQSEKTNYSSALKTLEKQQTLLQQGSPNTLQSLQANQPTPVAAVGKNVPNLDAEAMAQAKASNPGEYYATQSSYLYGLLNQMMYGAPSYQTNPSAPSQTAPGGAVVGTPLVGAGTGAA